MRLSVRISITLATVSMIISIFVAVSSYFYQLKHGTQQSQKLVFQAALGAQRAAAIAAYIKDDELADEILSGLELNDLIDSASIVYPQFQSSHLDEANSNDADINIDLFSPFVSNDKVGILKVTPNMHFITNSAREASLQVASLLLCLSLVTAIIVGICLRYQLTNPLRYLVYEFLKVDISNPDSPHKIDIHYQKKDEISLLIDQLNALVEANYRQFQSERNLRKRTEELQRQFRLIFEQTNAGIGLISMSGRVTMANPAMKVFFGEDVTGRLLHNFFYPPDDLKNELSKLHEKNTYSQVSIDLVAYTDNKKKHLNCLLSTIQDDRENYRPQSEQLIEIVIHDVTARREIEEKAKYEAAHDQLTGLLNRRAGNDALEKIMLLARQHDEIFGLLLIDLDEFKPVNDNYGHDIGDQVLEQVSERLTIASSSLQSACIRWGGDEFVVGVRVSHIDLVNTLAEDILHYIKSAMLINEHEALYVGASIGCVYFQYSESSHDLSLESFLKESDELMYLVKQSGKNNIKIKPLSKA